MDNKLRSCIAIIVSSVLLSSCFSKSDKTGSADDVTHSLICHTSNGDYLVTHEEIFHATSKSSGPGGTFTSGYADYRFTVRNLQTGEQLSRLVTGESKDDVLPLGYDGKQLWCYSADKSVGLHAREPASMQVTVTREALEKANPFLDGAMTTPNIYEATQFYDYDPVTNNIVLTDIQGNLFSLDPSSLKATPVKKKPSFNSFPHAHSTRADRLADMDISLSGEIRKQIDFDHDKRSEESYLNGEILLEQNVSTLSAIAVKLLAKSRNEIAQLQQRRDSLLKLYPVLKDQREAYSTIRDYHIPSRFYELQSDLERRERDSAGVQQKIMHQLDNIVLGGDSNYIYILHANNLTDTSSILITRTAIKGNESHPQWTTLVPQIYFDPSKGIKRNRMAEVFKSGNPQFRYEWYGVEGNVFVGIKMLFAFGIDVNTGKLLWKQQL